MPGIGIQVGITGDTSGLKGALDEAGGGLELFGQKINTTAVVGVAALAGGAALAVSAIADMTSAAAEDRAEQEKLNAIYVAAGAATGEYTTAINAAIEAGAAKAFSDSEVRAGLESLVIATGNAAEANQLLGPAMDIARLAGVDLETASRALAKAHDGNDAALRKLIPGLEKGATAADTIAAATELAAGQADIYAKSSEGMGKASSDAFAEIGETIGSAFLPIMDEIVPALLPIIQLLGELIKELLPLLKPAIMLIVGALRIFIDVLRAVIEGIKGVLDFVGSLIDKVRDAANFIGSVDLNPFMLPEAGGGGGAYPAPTARGRSARAGGAPKGGGNVTVNVYGGDPWRIERAVRRGYQGWTSGSGMRAPQREF